MGKPELGKLEPVPLRKAWESEGEFTPWLVKNIGMLCKALGLDELEVEETQHIHQGAASFNLACKDRCEFLGKLVEIASDSGLPFNSLNRPD